MEMRQRRRPAHLRYSFTKVRERRLKARVALPLISSRQSPDGCTDCPFACRSQDFSFSSYRLLILHTLAATGLILN